jgi:glycosyltransferase involved in cell wall biosynthesis
MATYNGAKFIRKQLNSILSQLGQEDELIISDDGSTDETLEIIQSLNDKRIILLHHTRKDYKDRKHSNGHYLVTDNFENALQASRGDYIFLSDQDDIWYPQKVSKMLCALQNADYVISNRSYMDADDVVYEYSVYPNNYLSRGIYQNLFINGFPGCHAAFRRNVLDACLPFPNGICVHDAWIARLAIVLKLRVVYLHEPLIKYRIHGNNTSSSCKPQNPLTFKLSYRIILLWNLILRSAKVKLGLHKNHIS